MDDWRVYAGVAVLVVVVVLFFQALERAAEREYADRQDARANRTTQAVAAYATVNRAPYPLLQTLNYGPHTQVQPLPGPERAPLALADPVVGESLAAAPAFATLLAQGLIGPGRPLLLGYSADGPLVGGWKDLYSSAVAGLSGSGKTTTLRFLAAQSAAQGARFLILDPHADAGDESLAGTLAPLAPAFLAPPASDPRAMLRLLEQAQTVMQTRLAGGARPWPLIVAVDEFTALMGRSDLAGPLAGLIEAIAQEGRKVQVFALISGQIFTAARSGSTALRDALASAYIHRMKRTQARLLIGAEDAIQAEGLRAGQALLARADGDLVRVTIPDTKAADMVSVATLLATHPATIIDVQATNVATTPASPWVATNVATTPHTSDVSQEADRALDLFIEHQSMARVVQIMDGITSSQGRIYQEAVTRRSADVAAAMAAYRGQA